MINFIAIVIFDLDTEYIYENIHIYCLLQICNQQLDNYISFYR